jgi:hypothetical protein
MVRGLISPGCRWGAAGAGIAQRRDMKGRCRSARRWSNPAISDTQRVVRAFPESEHGMRYGLRSRLRMTQTDSAATLSLRMAPSQAASSTLCTCANVPIVPWSMGGWALTLVAKVGYNATLTSEYRRWRSASWNRPGEENLKDSRVERCGRCEDRGLNP